MVPKQAFCQDNLRETVFDRGYAEPRKAQKHGKAMQIEKRHKAWTLRTRVDNSALDLRRMKTDGSIVEEMAQDLLRAQARAISPPQKITRSCKRL